MKKLLVSFGIAVLFLPSLTSAAIFCPNLSQDMWYGSCDQSIDDTDCARHVTGTQVSDLQHFLKDLYGSPLGLRQSGFFGNRTKFYVTKFQDENDLPTTGRAGPLTRAAIADLCKASNTQTNSCPIYTPPSCDNGTLISKGANQNGCSLGYYCKPNTTSFTCPVINIPQCIGGTLVSNGTDANGCSLGYYCKQTTTITCPIINAPLCTDGTLISNGTDANGCSLGYYCKQDFLSCPVYQPPQCTGGHYVSRGVDANGCSLGYMCVLDTASTQSCTLDGVTLTSDSTRTFYQSRTSTNCSAVSQSRLCANGTLAGDASYQYASCTQSISNTQSTLTATPSSGPAPLTVTFSGNSPGGYSLDYGDGSLGPNVTCDFATCGTQTINATHTYASAGTFTAVLHPKAGGSASASAQVTVSGGAGNPSIAITAPTSATSVANGGTLHVAWSGANVPQAATVSVFAVGPGAPVPVIGNASLVGSTDWTVNGVPAQYNLYAYIYNSDHSQILATSQPVPLTITAAGGGTAASITLTYPPASGATVVSGSTITVTWQTQNAPAGGVVQVYLYGPDGSPLPYIAVYDTQNSGQILLVGSSAPLAAGTYTVRAKLINAAGTVVATSDSPLTITSAAGGNTATITIIAPQPGATVHVGSSQTISWTTGGSGWSSGSQMQIFLKSSSGNLAPKTLATNQNVIGGTYKWNVAQTDTAYDTIYLVLTDGVNPVYATTQIPITITGGTNANNQITLTPVPSSGNAPLSVRFSLAVQNLTVLDMNHLFIDHGDGSAPYQVWTFGCTTGSCSDGNDVHTYTTPGTYTAKFTSAGTVLATSKVTVTGPVSSAGNTAQLANALTALALALDALQKLLTR
jgi:hypothetical protein